MGGVDAALDSLSIVVLLDIPGGMAMSLRDTHPFHLRQLRRQVSGPHVSPEDSRRFLHWVGSKVDLILEDAVFVL